MYTCFIKPLVYTCILYNTYYTQYNVYNKSYIHIYIYTHKYNTHTHTHIYIYIYIYIYTIDVTHIIKIIFLYGISYDTYKILEQL